MPAYDPAAPGGRELNDEMLRFFAKVSAPPTGGVTITGIGGGAFSGTAADVPFTPFGSIAATDTNAAVLEAASDAASALSTHAALTAAHGIADTSVLALRTDKLSVFAVTTSAELAGILSDEAGSSGGFVRAGSPTIVTPTIASFVNSAHTHQDAAGGGVLDHGLAISGLTDDDHTQYALLAGRSGGQSIIGGTASSNDLTLLSTSHATIGRIIVNSGVRSFLANATFTARQLAVHSFSSTYTLNFASANWGGNNAGVTGLINMGPTLLAQQNTSSIASVSFKSGTSLSNVAGSGTTTLGAAGSFRAETVTTADTDTITAGANADFYSSPTYTVANGGTLNMSTDMVNFESLLTLTGALVNFSGTYAAFAMLPPAVTSSTLAKLCGFRVGASTSGSTENFGIHLGFGGGAWGGAGTNIGLYIQTAPTSGTSNIGISNAGSIRQIGAAVFGINAEPTAGYGVEVRAGSLGYGVGTGGTVTQATSKATGVTLSKQCGAITMNAAALATATTVSFTLTNTTIGANDIILLTHQSAGTAGAYNLNAQAAAGSASISVRNVSAGSLSEAIVISFAVIKGAVT